MDLTIHHIPGQLPQPWSRKVAFFANILSLFYGNHAETEVLRREVGALETYGSRLIPVVNLMFGNQNNLLVLEREPVDDLIRYFSQELGLSLPELKMITHDVYLQVEDADGGRKDELTLFIDELRRHPAEYIDGYVVDDTLARLAEKTGKKVTCRSEGSRKGNNKLLLFEYLRSTGLPMFDTRVAATPLDVVQCLRDLKQQGYHYAVLKAPVGASGIGMQKVNLGYAGQTLDIPDYLFYEGGCLVQGWLDDSVDGVTYIGSPSVQLFLRDDSCDLYDITDQILSRDSIHEGNMAPARIFSEDKQLEKEIFQQAEAAVRWLSAQGYRGTASIDFHLIERNGVKELRICEVNARVTGATYPALLARHFSPKGAWLMRNVRFSPAIAPDVLLEVLMRNDLLFWPGRDTGVLPFNFNPDDAGQVVKGQFVFLGSTVNDTALLLEQMLRVPSLKGDYDRD